MSAFTLGVVPLHESMVPGAETTEAVLVRVRAAREPSGPRPKLTAVLVLDTSGSMMGEPIDQVIQSAKRLTEILGDNDSLGVVAFSGSAQTVSPIRELGLEARREAAREIATLSAGGSTNISGGLSHAMLLLGPREPQQRQILLLLSDGQPNVGAETPRDLAAEVKLIRARQIAVSALGYGEAHSDDIMIAIADAGGGRYAFVSDPRLAASSFARALGAQRDVVAEDLRLTLTPTEGVEILEIHGDPPTTFGADGLNVTLSDLIAGDELNVVIELRVRAPRERGPWRTLKVALSGKAPGGGREDPRGDASVVLTDAGPYEVDRGVAAALSIARADAMRTQARAHADKGDYAVAAQILRKAKALLEQTPGYLEGEGALGDARETLVDEIAAMARVPDRHAYEEFKKASRDYADFAASGSKARGGGSPESASPATRAMMDLMAGPVAIKAALVVVAGPSVGAVYPLGASAGIGRSPDNLVALKSPSISRRHARVEYHQGKHWVLDMKSTCGISVNGQQVDRHPLEHGDVIELGEVRLRYETQ